MFQDFITEATRRGRCLPHRRVRLQTPDDLTLMAGLFEPEQPASRVIVLFPGAGANMNVGYLDLARDLHSATGAAVVVPDVRGHGLSQGPRGYTDNRTRVWADVDLWIDWVVQTYPGAQITLGGHSAGAILCLNRVTQLDQPLHPAVSDLIAIAPYFAGAARLRSAAGLPQAAFDLPGFAVRAGEEPQPDLPAPLVVRFNYPADVARLCNLVPGYTAEMSAALSPREIEAQLSALPLPCHVFAAEGDELFPAEGLAALIAEAKNPNLHFTRIGAGHLTCLYHGGPEIAVHLRTKEAAL